VPIVWNDSTNGGFNDGHAPWQCVNPLYPEINIKKDIESEKSVYRFYRKLLRIRKTHEAAVMGEIQEYDHENRRVIAYSRTYQGKKLFICANFSKHTTIYNFPDELGKYKIVLNNYQVNGRPARLPFVGKKGQKLILKPYQAVVLSCQP
jgi:glycosidase